MKKIILYNENTRQSAHFHAKQEKGSWHLGSLGLDMVQNWTFYDLASAHANSLTVSFRKLNLFLLTSFQEDTVAVIEKSQQELAALNAQEWARFAV